MESIEEKFKRSAVRKKTVLDYSIHVDRPSLDSPTLFAKSSKIEINFQKLIPNTCQPSPNSTLPTSLRSIKRFNTSKNKGFEISSKPSLDKSFFDVSIDFNVSMKNFQKVQFFVESPLKKLERKSTLSNSKKETNFERQSKSKKEKKNLIEEEKNLKKIEVSEKEVIDEFSAVDTFEDKQENKSESKNKNEDKAKTKRKIRAISQIQTEFQFFSFFHALNKFYQLPEIYTEINLWSVSFLEKCCCFKEKSKLSSEFQELCEKVIIFAYTELDPLNSFHSNLLTSVHKRLCELVNNSETWVCIGFSSNNPYDKDLKHDIAPFGLLLILFLIEYIPMTLESMIQYCLGYEIAFIPLAFDVAETLIFALRKKKLNEFIIQTQKCLETLCFFYAGCLAQWFVLHKENQHDLIKLNKKLECQAMSKPKTFIELANNLLKFQT